MERCSSRLLKRFRGDLRLGREVLGRREGESGRVVRDLRKEEPDMRFGFLGGSMGEGREEDWMRELRKGNCWRVWSVG
jgi:hypothetical protein